MKRWLPVNADTNPSASGWPRSDRAASCSPAAQPSARAASAATAASDRGPPGPAGACRSSAAASAGVNRSSAARSSASCPRARSRDSASGGSLRLVSTTPSPGGRYSRRKTSDSCTGPASIR